MKIGARVGKLEVISQAEPSKRGVIRWNCRCDCGTELVLDQNVLENHKVGSCGCDSKYADLTGQKFGMLTVLSRAEFCHNGHPQWMCRCDCGNVVKVQDSTLRNKKVTFPYPNCGCTTRSSSNRVSAIEPGAKIGKLTVLGPAKDGKRGCKRWMCRCECGNELIANESALLAYHIQSCGCVDQAENLAGKRFGRLTVIRRDINNPTGEIQWLCQCDCGNTKTVTQNWLTHAKEPSCGCYHKEVTHERFFKHGMKNHPLYEVWCSMKKRCENPNSEDYKNYGGRGISVCDRWEESFENFYEDMKDGYQPGLELDRIDNDGPYSPENCHWVTHKENQRNKRTNRVITTAIGTKTVAEQAEISGVNYGTIRDRLDQGMPEELAIIPNPSGKHIDIESMRKLFDQDEPAILLDEQTEKKINDAIETAEVQAKAIEEWGFGPEEIILEDQAGK